MRFYKYIYLFYVGLFSIQFACNQEYSCTSTNTEDFESVEQAIINGTVVDTNSPFAKMVLIQYQRGSSLGYCTGVLITNEWILTASHCIANGDMEGSHYSVYLGTELNPIVKRQPACPNTQIRTVERFVVHPEQIADLALFHTNSPFVIQQATTGYQLDIYEGTKESLVGKTLIQFGYGLFDDTSVLDGQLRRAPFIVNKITDYSKDLFFYENSSAQTGAHGDSGGPFFLPDTYTLAAIYISKVGPNSEYNLAVPSDRFRTWVLSQIQ